MPHSKRVSQLGSACRPGLPSMGLLLFCQATAEAAQIHSSAWQGRGQHHMALRVVQLRLARLQAAELATELLQALLKAGSHRL